MTLLERQEFERTDRRACPAFNTEKPRMPPIDPRDFGRLEAEVEELGKKVDAMAAQVRLMCSLMDQAKGSWRILVGVAGLTSAMTALAIKLLPFWPFR